MLAGAIPAHYIELLDGLVSRSALAINLLNSSRRRRLVDRAPTRAQELALERLARHWWLLARHMGKERVDCPHDATALQRLISKGAGGSAVPLVASRVDTLDTCGLVDPAPHVSAGVRVCISDPSRLLRDDRGELQTAITFGGGPRFEYIKLIRAQCRARKVVLSRTCEHAAAVFAVAKPDGRQREVWHGTDFSSACRKPPRPPWLTTPSDLGSLEASDTRPLLMTKRDGKAFFDQLYADPVLRPWLGKPSVTVDELCGNTTSPSDTSTGRPLTRDELVGALTEYDSSDLDGTLALTPLARCWPMGSSWASTLAQSVMTSAALKSGIHESQLLSSENALPPDDLPAVSVATDDVIIIERLTNADMAPGTVSDVAKRLDDTWQQLGIVGKSTKTVDRALDETALGMDLVRGRLLLPKRSRLLDLVSALVSLLTLERISAADLGHVFEFCCGRCWPTAPYWQLARRSTAPLPAIHLFP